ncbi:MAG: drug:proton antiporter, partial [Alphaproteobacteria bacterium HGW-Alphaproteobacteria-2]
RGSRNASRRPTPRPTSVPRVGTPTPPPWSTAAAALVASAAWLSPVPRLVFWAAGGIAGVLLLLVLASTGLRRGARALARSRALARLSLLRGALGAVGGPGGEVRATVLALGLGLSVLAAIGQIETNLRGAIADELPEVAPSYFVLDIQPAQIEPFRAMLAANPGVHSVTSAPMLRGVITRINGRPAQEVAGNHWVLRGDRGVSYANTPPEGTTITAGDWWPEGFDGPPQMSFAAEEAAEMGLRLGDEITVNILGRDLTARITSFREVDFSTARMDFVMIVNSDALAGAPHTHLASIHADEAAEAAILRDLATAFPNITAVRVRDAIARVSGILSGIAAAVTYAAGVTLATGVVVLVGAAAAGTQGRLKEAAILKTLGATRARVLAGFALRSALMGLAAGAVAVLGGALAGWGVITFVMETEFRFAPGPALGIVAGGVLATLLAGLAFAWGPLAARPARVLRARE